MTRVRLAESLMPNDPENELRIVKTSGDGYREGRVVLCKTIPGAGLVGTAGAEV